jgi:hypothetical protein
MAGVLWGLGGALTCVSLILYWSARVTGVESFAADAGVILVLALACLSLVWTWLGTLIFLVRV